jgi:hypothetical protein
MEQDILGEKRESTASRLLPNFVILGAQKSASTFVHRCLEEHPEVYIPNREVRFFENPEFSESKLEDLTNLFTRHTSKAVRGIKRADYLGKPEVPERLKTYMPDAKLITVLRNPVDRLLSAYFYYIKLGFLPVKPIEEGMNDVLAGKMQGYPRANDLIEYGLYYKHLTRYLQLFPQERLLVLLHEDVQHRPLEVIKDIYRFLEIDPNYVPRGLDRRENTGLYSLPRLHFLSRRNALLFSYNKDRTRLYRNKLSPFVYLKVGAVTAIDKFVLSRLYGNEKPKLSEELRRNLYDFYHEDIAALEDFLGRSLVKWKIK